VQFFVVFGALRIETVEGGRQVPETDVCALGHVQDHFEVAPRLEEICGVVGSVKNGVHVRLQTIGALKFNNKRLK